MLDRTATARRVPAAVVLRDRAHPLTEETRVADLADLTLNDGHTLPAIGFGTYPLDDAQARGAIVSAAEVGYRLVDSAVNYGNEAGVGAGVRDTGIREQLVVTTKVPGRDHGYDETLRSLDGSLERLGLDRVDLYLIHWPNPSVDRYVDTWRAMIAARDAGKVRSIGVSNFTEAHLRRLADETGVLPAVNQVEMHPYFPQDGLRAFHDEHGIVTEAWSPLGRRSDLLDNDTLAGLARDKGVSVTRLVLAWHRALGSVPLPKAASREHQAENLDVAGIELTDDEVAAVSALERGRIGGDPDHHEEM